LNLGEVIHKIPNIAFHIATINTESIALTSWDIHPYRIKALWDPYFSYAQGVIFVIDLSDSDAFSEALEELKKLFDDENL
jgi:GTPase SAR1 family protein